MRLFLRPCYWPYPTLSACAGPKLRIYANEKPETGGCMITSTADLKPGVCFKRATREVTRRSTSR